jgi:hypothetical protein
MGSMAVEFRGGRGAGSAGVGPGGRPAKVDRSLEDFQEIRAGVGGSNARRGLRFQTESGREELRPADGAHRQRERVLFRDAERPEESHRQARQLRQGDG